MRSDRLLGTWVLERADGIDVTRPHGVLIVTPEAWFSMQVGDQLACAGRYGLDGDRLLLDPAVALTAGDVGRVRAWHCAYDGDALVLTAPDGSARLRWHREGAEVVTSVGVE